MTTTPPSVGDSRPDRVRALLHALGIGVAMTVLVLGPGAPAASAHDQLVAATPADGSSVATAPDSVELEFSGVVQELGSQVVVRGPDGTAVSDGDPQVVDSTLTQALSPGLPAGTYTVDWRVTSADGHPISGSTSFTVTTDAAGGGSAAGAQASAPRPADSSSSGLWIGIGAAAVLLVALAVAARQLRRNR